MDDKDLILNEDAVPVQLLLLFLAVAFSGTFLVVSVFERSFAGFITGAVSAFVFYIVIKLNNDMNDVYTDGKVFTIKNLYKKKIVLNADQFDKIVDMKTIMWHPDSPYYTILFKNGAKFNFSKTRFTFFGFPIRSKERLSQELTEKVRAFIEQANQHV